MKKIVLSIGLIMTVLSVAVSQTVDSAKLKIDSTVKLQTVALPDSAKLTAYMVYSDIKSKIEGLGAGLKIGAEHIYSVFVRQQLVNSIVYCSFAIVSFLTLSSFFRGAKRKDEPWSDESGGPTSVGIFRVIQMIIGIIMFILVLIFSRDIITGFVNPEYGAIKEIIGFIKQ